VVTTGITAHLAADPDGLTPHDLVTEAARVLSDRFTQTRAPKSPAANTGRPLEWDRKDVRWVLESLMKAKGFSQRKRFVHERADSRLLFGGFADLRERSFGVLLHFVSSSRTGLTACSHSNFLGVSLPGFWFTDRFDAFDAGVPGFQYTSK
jgi:hypothetical protein